MRSTWVGCPGSPLWVALLTRYLPRAFQVIAYHNACAITSAYCVLCGDSAGLPGEWYWNDKQMC